MTLQDNQPPVDVNNDAPDTSSNDGNNSNTSEAETGEDTDAISFGDGSLQTKEEFEQAKNIDHTAEDNTISDGGGIDDAFSNSDGAAGTDRAGTAERKDYGDTELNKGLESQAMDEEGTNL